MLRDIDRKTALKAGAIQLVLVAILGAVLGVSLSHHFFESWGWLAGPAAWLICAAITGALLRLAVPMVLLGAVLSGIPSGLATLTGVHWLGVVVGIALFGLWCGWLVGRQASN